MNLEEQKEFIAALQHKEYIIIKLTKLPYGGSLRNRPIWCEYGLPILERSEWMTWREMVKDPRYNYTNGSQKGWFPFVKSVAKAKGII